MIEFLTLENIIYIIAALILLIVVLLVWNIRLELKTKKLMCGKNGRSLEEAFLSMQKDLKEVDSAEKEVEKYLKVVEKRLSTTLRGFSNVSFNAFKGMDSGGKSFATTFLNENGDGIILSSLQARDRVSIFTKQVRNYKADIDLSDEEQESLTKAKESCSL